DGDAAANAERARVNVTRALRSTIKRIAARAPRLGRYLDLSVQTGASCIFAPPPDFELITRAPDAPVADPNPQGRAKRALVSIALTGATARGPNAEPLAARHDATVRAQAGFFGGHAMARTGDRTLLVFLTVDAALRCTAALLDGADAPVRAGL